MAVLLVCALIAVCGFLGFRSGVVRRLIELVGLVASILVSARFASAVTPWLQERTALDETPALLLSYVLVFVAGLVATWLIAAAVQKGLRLTILGWLDRLGGAVCGILLGALLASVGLIANSQAPGGERVREAFERSAVGHVIYRAAPELYLGARRLAGQKGDELWERALDAGRGAVDDAREKVDEMREQAEERLDRD